MGRVVAAHATEEGEGFPRVIDRLGKDSRNSHWGGVPGKHKEGAECGTVGVCV